MDHLYDLCLVLVMLSRSFIAALWSHEEKGLTSRLSFVLFIVICYFPIWYPGTCVVLDCIDFLILAVFLTYAMYNQRETI